MRHRLVLVATLAGLGGLGGGALGCSSRDTPTPARYDGGPPPRRVIGSPPRHVRALPPHAISAEGVGPYKLDVPMAQILSSLPSGPRMALLQIPGVLDYTVVRDEGLLVGGERQGAASFIGIVRQDIARTAVDGVGVGATAAALTAALGPALHSATTARDPALWVGVRLVGARFVLARDRVAGVLLTAAAAAPSSAAIAPPVGDLDAGVAAVAAPPRCERAALAADDFAGVAAGGRVAAACLGGADGVVQSGDQVIVATRGARDGAPARRVAALELRGLRWVAPLEVERGRDELVAITETRDAAGRAFSVVALRLEGTRLVRVADEVVYRLDEQRAAWIGASLDDLTLHLEVTVDGDALAVGGVLVHAGRTATRDLAPLLPVTVRRRGRVSDAERVRADAGAPDAGVAGVAGPDAHVGDAAAPPP